MRFFSDNAAAVHPEVMAALAEANTLDTAYDGDARSQALDGRLVRPVRHRGRGAVGADRHRGELPRARRLVPAAWRRGLPPRRAYPERRGRRARILHPWRQADARRRRGREADARQRSPRCSTRSPTTSTASSRTRSRSPTRPNMAASIRPTRSPRSARWRGRAGWDFHMDGARFANAVATLGCVARRPDVAGGGRRAELRLRQEWRRCRPRRLVFFRPELAEATLLPPQARGAPAVQGPLSRRADPGDARGRPVAATTPAPPMRARRELAEAAGGAAGPSGRGERGVPAVTPDEAAALRAQGFDFYDWAPGEVAAGDALGQRRRDDRALAAAIGRCERAHGSPRSTRRDPGPVHFVTLIWGSTWLVIRDQLGPVPPTWSVTYRFLIAAAGDVRLRAGDARAAARSTRAAGHSPRRIGARAIRAQLQLRLSRRAAHHLGPGRGGVRAAAGAQRACLRGSSSSSAMTRALRRSDRRWRWPARAAVPARGARGAGAAPASAGRASA